MKKIDSKLLAIPLSLFSMQAMAQATIFVSGTQNLHFGSFASGPSSGTITINPASGARTSTGGVTLVSGSGLEANGVISLTGSTGLAITLSMAAGAFTISNGADNMNVSSFDFNTLGAGDNIVLTLATSTETISVGGTITVGANQAAGTYTGNYTVNAVYQ